jgi:hypothetical protein
MKEEPKERQPCAFIAYISLNAPGTFIAKLAPWRYIVAADEDDVRESLKRDFPDVKVTEVLDARVCPLADLQRLYYLAQFSQMMQAQRMMAQMNGRIVLPGGGQPPLIPPM